MIQQIIKYACFFSFGSTQIRVDNFCSVPRQEGGQNLEPEILLIPLAVGTPLNHANLVIQTFDKPQRDLVEEHAIRRDAVPVPVDQGGKFLKRPEPFPLELLAPTGEALPAQPSRR